MKPTSQSDYTKRIERVITAVAASLEQEQALPSTATLAGIANFSPFHFMRVYRALAGESLGATVQRLRLTRAAHLLAQQFGAHLGDCWPRRFRDAAGVRARFPPTLRHGAE